jgi:hypothetical protein
MNTEHRSPDRHYSRNPGLAMSSLRQIDRLHAPLIVTYGTNDAPEFQRQARDFAAAVKAAGKPVELIQAANFGHQEMLESLSNPYGPNGRAALRAGESLSNGSQPWARAPVRCPWSDFNACEPVESRSKHAFGGLGPPPRFRARWPPGTLTDRKFFERRNPIPKV